MQCFEQQYLEQQFLEQQFLEQQCFEQQYFEQQCVYFCVHGACTGLNGPCIQKSDCVGKVLWGALRAGPSSDPPSDFAHRVRFLDAGTIKSSACTMHTK